MSKGSRQRGTSSAERARFEAGWEAIFGKRVIASSKSTRASLTSTANESRKVHVPARLAP